MVDTTTPVLGLVKQTIGGNRNTWGAILNSCMDLIEGAFYGMTSVAVTGAADVTLTDSQRRKRILVFSGTLTADQNIIIANLVGRWTVRNATTGDFALKIKTSSGTAVTIPQGGICDVTCDGSNNMFAGLSTRLRDTQMLSPDGALAAPGASWASEVASGFYRVSAGVFAWVVAGVERVRVSATAFAITLASTGVAKITINGTDVVTVSENAVAIVGSFTVGGQSPVPIGFSGPYDGITEPNGWKFRNGQALSRTTYSALFNILTLAISAQTQNNTSVINLGQDLRWLGLEGAKVEGTGIASGTTIVSINPTNGLDLTLSQAAVGSQSITLRIFPHGNGDGSTTFNVPDRRGRADVGRDNMGGTSAGRLTGQTGGVAGTQLGAAGGEERQTLSASQIASHSHGVNDPGHNHNLPGTTGTSEWSTSSGPQTGALAFPSSAPTNSATTNISLASAGGDQPHNNVQPSGVSNSIIFTGVYT